MMRTLSVSLILMILIAGCERSSVDGLPGPTLTNNPEVFIDGFSPGLEYFPYDDGYAKLDAFVVDREVTYNNSEASMRLDIPNENNPDGWSYSGAAFQDIHGGRNLTDYDALVFYAKASQVAQVNSIGFGQDGVGNYYQVELERLRLSTVWQEYAIPIPNPDKLTASKGLFWFTELPEFGNGYSIWIDSLRYERLETFGQPRAEIYESGTDTISSYSGVTTTITGTSVAVTRPNGTDMNLNIGPGYLDYITSDPSVATVDELGIVTLQGQGQATITAELNGLQATGSLVVNSFGDYIPAPTPTESSSDVISLFSDAYTNVPVDYYNGFFTPDGQTTQGGTGFDGGPAGADIVINGDGFIHYTDLNFVGIGTFLNVSPIDASGMTHLHVDIQVNESIDPGDYINLQLLNGVQTAGEISGTVTIAGSTLKENEWVSIDVRLSSFAGLTNRSALGLLFFVSDATISDIYVDNIYYYDDGTPDPVPPSVPVTFDDENIVYAPVAFNGASFQLVANPDQTGSNTEASQVGEVTNIGVNWEGIYFDLTDPVDFSEGQTITMDVWSDDAIPVLLKFEEGSGGAADVEVSANHTGSGWEELSFTFSSSAAYSRLVLFFDGPGTTAGAFYVDNIEQN